MPGAGAKSTRGDDAYADRWDKISTPMPSRTETLIQQGKVRGRARIQAAHDRMDAEGANAEKTGQRVPLGRQPKGRGE